jgi:hypothetical protein
MPWGAVRTMGLFVQNIVTGEAHGETRGSRDS